MRQDENSCYSRAAIAVVFIVCVPLSQTVQRSEPTQKLLSSVAAAHPRSPGLLGNGNGLPDRNSVHARMPS